VRYVAFLAEKRWVDASACCICESSQIPSRAARHRRHLYVRAHVTAWEEDKHGEGVPSLRWAFQLLTP
jgi:hypothetical protein